MMRTPRARLLLVLIASAASVALVLRPHRAYSEEPSKQAATSQSSSSDANQDQETVTIEARRKNELKHQISRFVSSTVVSYLHDSLARWNTPVCPLVAGLPADRGEFILGRVSQIARTSHAPLAGEHCKPNFFIVVTADPDLLLKSWSKRDFSLVNNCNGFGYIRDFMHSQQPVRVWYNVTVTSSPGVKLTSDTFQLELAGVILNFMLPPCAAGGGRVDTRLSYGVVQELTSVIVVVDGNRTTGINIGQLTDYVAMVGLAQIQPNADTGAAPTILRLFRETNEAPQGLSPWDESLLHSLYTTNQDSVMQVSAIKQGMFEQIAH